MLNNTARSLREQALRTQFRRRDYYNGNGHLDNSFGDNIKNLWKDFKDFKAGHYGFVMMANVATVIPNFLVGKALYESVDRKSVPVKEVCVTLPMTLGFGVLAPAGTVLGAVMGIGMGFIEKYNSPESKAKRDILRELKEEGYQKAYVAERIRIREQGVTNEPGNSR